MHRFISPSLSVVSQRQRLVILDVPRISTSVLDAVKIADVILFAISAEEGTDDLGDHLISMIKAQGLPSVIGCLTNLDVIPEKNQNEVRRSFTKHFHFHFPGEPRFLPLQSQSQQDAAQLLRFICSTTPKPSIWREARPFLLVQNVKYEEGSNITKIEGYLRGAPLSANNLIHLPNFGDFQLKQIDTIRDPNPLKKHSGGSSSSPPLVTVVEVADQEKREGMEEENPIEEMDDFFSDTASVTSTKRKKKVPKGTSDYQAAWIVDEAGSGEDEEEEEEEEGVTTMKGGDSDNEKESEAEVEEEEEEEEEEKEEEEEDLDFPMDEASIKRAKAAEYAQYPDEVDTPLDMPARVRFQKYRGLKSFRSSPWDPKENLPVDYGRIFQFQNFTRAKKRIMSEQQGMPAKTGMYLILHIEGVPKSFTDEFDPESAIPVILSGLLKYERKVSVINFVVQKHPSYEAPVESKEELVIQCGFRTYRARPVYSQNNPNCDKHKYEKFLHPGTTTIATIYAPITFPPAPVLMFRESGARRRNNEGKEDKKKQVGRGKEDDDDDEKEENKKEEGKMEEEEEDNEVMKLAATGYIHSLNPDRVILKKILLSGHPFKIRKRTVVSRYMFFNPDDIRWFKPVELHTKLGRIGHIIEPLGTHGLMKCIFDGRMQANDTILMALYKRVFPMWKASYALPSSAPSSASTSTSTSSTFTSSTLAEPKKGKKSVTFGDEMDM